MHLISILYPIMGYNISMIVNLSLSIVATGAVYQKDSRSTAIDFINWLKEQGMNPTAQQGKLTKTEDIVDLIWHLDLSKYGSEHEVNFQFTPQWRQPNDTYIDGNLSFHPNSNQFTVRMNILPPDLVKNLSDYDGLAEKVASFAETLHQKIKAKVTIVDKNRTRFGFNAYNLKGLPLWIGWYSFYDPIIKSKHIIPNKISVPSDVNIINKKEMLVIHSTKKWAGYHQYGWEDEAKNYFKLFSGRLLNNK